VADQKYEPPLGASRFKGFLSSTPCTAPDPTPAVPDGGHAKQTNAKEGQGRRLGYAIDAACYDALKGSRPEVNPPVGHRRARRKPNHQDPIGHIRGHGQVELRKAHAKARGAGGAIGEGFEV
jgi:hypothetical protein